MFKSINVKHNQHGRLVCSWTPHLDQALAPEALRAGSELHTPAHTHTQKVHKMLYYLRISPLFDLAKLQTHPSLRPRFIIVYHFINTGNILGGDFIANFYPNTPCKRTSLKFMQLMIKCFLYIPRLLYSPNCSNK